MVISRYIFCSFCDAFDESTDVENNASGESNNHQSTPLQISDSDYEPDSKEDTSDSDNKEDVAIGNLRRFSRDIWGKCLPVKRSKIPHDINGTCVYKVSVDVGNKWRNLQDGRSWGPSMRTEWSGYQQVRYFNCNGFYQCPSPQCPFLIEFKRANKFHFDKVQKEHFCRQCGCVALFSPCSARKYVAFNGDIADVYHHGQHVCEAREVVEKPFGSIKEVLKVNPDTKPLMLQRNIMDAAIRNEDDWDKVAEKAKQLVDRKWIANELQKARKQEAPEGHTFEGVFEFKAHTDKRDPFYIYRVDPNMGIVFKTSRRRLEFALNMAQDGDHFLSQEFCFFDGKVKRVRNFTSLTASVYHPLLRKQKILATMECKGENADTVVQFWTYFNDALSEYAGRQVIFNPIGWSADNGGAITSGIKEVFGVSGLSRLKTCEFHFRDSVNKRANAMSSQEAKATFKSLAAELLKSITVAGYHQSKENLDAFIEMSPSRMQLSNWLSWWHNRRFFIFRAFAPDGPRMNQAEVVHASWVNSSSSNLTLLRAAREDVKENELLEAEYSLYLKGACKEGTGPSYSHLKMRSEARDLEAGHRAGLELESEQIMEAGPDAYNAADYFVDPSSSFKPPNILKGNRKEVAARKRGRSKVFNQSLTKALQEKNSMRLRKYELNQTSLQATVFTKTMGADDKGYAVEVCVNPKCSCPFYTSKVGSQVCKHLIWIYLNVFKLKEDSDVIQQIKHTSDTVQALLSTAPETIPNELRYNEMEKKKDYKASFANDSSRSKPQAWFLTYKASKAAKCRGCRKVLEVSSLCVSAEAKFIPFKQDQPLPCTFYFCPERKCIKVSPPWTNLKCPARIPVKSFVKEEDKNKALNSFVPL